VCWGLLKPSQTPRCNLSSTTPWLHATARSGRHIKTRAHSCWSSWPQGWRSTWSHMRQWWWQRMQSHPGRWRSGFALGWPPPRAQQSGREEAKGVGDLQHLPVACGLLVFTLCVLYFVQAVRKECKSWRWWFLYRRQRRHRCSTGGRHCHRRAAPSRFALHSTPGVACVRAPHYQGLSTSLHRRAAHNAGVGGQCMHQALAIVPMWPWQGPGSPEPALWPQPCSFRPLWLREEVRLLRTTARRLRNEVGSEAAAETTVMYVYTGERVIVELW